jgi:hypothetical protein
MLVLPVGCAVDPPAPAPPLLAAGWAAARLGERGRPPTSVPEPWRRARVYVEEEAKASDLEVLNLRSISTV